MNISPESGFNAPARMLISVLLPAPFWPMRPHTSPDATDRSTPPRAIVAPNALRMPRISKRGGEVAPALILRAPDRPALSSPAAPCFLSRDVDAGVDPLLHLLTLDVTDQGLDRQVSHPHWILEDNAV